MKFFYAIVLTSLFSSCGEKKSLPVIEKDKISHSEMTQPEFQSIIDSANVNGAILIYDVQKDLFYSNDFEWALKGRIPASTFKIANSIIALETGVVENDSTLFKWKGEKRALKNWEQDLIFKDAFHFSCVPCYQEIARNIGLKRMTEYLKTLNYGEMIVDSSNIDVFWLEGDSRISQFQQIDFLKRFYQSELPITDRTVDLMKRLMVIEKKDDYVISGKSGWSIRNGNNNGWFVGYLESKDKIYFFATNVEPGENFKMDEFPAIRKDVTYKAFRRLGIIQ